MLPRYQDSFAREAISTLTHASGMLPEATKIIDFTTHTTTCCNEEKTYYLLHFNYILGMPKAPKYWYLGYPKSTISGPIATVPTHPVAWHQAPHNTTIPATQWPGTRYTGSRHRVPKYQNPSRARPNPPLPWVQACCPGPLKSSILRATLQHCCNKQKT